MKCPNCGLDNPEGANFCNNCGKDIAPKAVVPGEVRQRQCIECGRSISWEASVCAYCGHDFRPKLKSGTEGYLVTGAVLTIVAGILAIALLTITVGQAGNLSVEGMTLLVISYVCSAVGLIGGILALTRRMFPLAVLGAVCAIFSPAFYFAIPGLVLIVKSAAQFKDTEAPLTASHY